MKTDMARILKNELSRTFTKRCERNPSYSLRAYARDLNIDATLLSRLLKGQRNFSAGMIRRLADELNLPFRQRTPRKIQKLDDSAFQPISNWHYFAILELFLLPDFQSNSHWVAKRLGLKAAEASIAVQILNDFGYIDTSQTPWVINSQGTSWASPTATTREKMNYQKRLLEKAKAAIDSIDFSQRENASLTLAASRRLIPEIKKRIQAFKNELRELIESEENYDEVYQIVISYFPLSKTTNE